MSSDTEYPFLDNCAADIRLLGCPNIFNSFAANTSSPRANMANHHLSQAMVVDKPEPNKIFTGAEHNLIEHTFNNSHRDHDCEIVAIIPKYQPTFLKGGVEKCPQVYVIVLAYDPEHENPVLDYFVIDRYFMGTNGLGFIPKIENIHRIAKGEILDKETVITHSNNVNDNLYQMGVNLNIAYGSFPETIEDAFVVSESAAIKLGTTQVSQCIINCRMDRRPLNLYGDEYVDKFLPDIGTKVRDDGILCGFRPVHWTTTVADTDPEALRIPLSNQDDISYIEPGAEILDLTFNVNRSKMNNCYNQALLYMEDNTKCWEAIYSTYTKYKGKHRLSPKMSTLVTTAIYRMIVQGTSLASINSEFRKEMNKFDIEGVNNETIEFLQVIVTYKIPRPINHGAKLTDLHGSR